MTCPHCGIPLKKPVANHADRCATASPADREYYRAHRRWPSIDKRSKKARTL